MHSHVALAYSFLRIVGFSIYNLYGYIIGALYAIIHSDTNWENGKGDHLTYPRHRTTIEFCSSLGHGYKCLRAQV